MVIRRGTPGDLEAVAAIQRESREAAQWDAADYLQHELWVAVESGEAGPGTLAGFVVARTVAPGEHELLNLAVASGHRRRGVGRRLVSYLLTQMAGSVWLEVRASNAAAREFYKCLGFQEVGRRAGYYDLPPEAAIVMKFRSC